MEIETVRQLIQDNLGAASAKEDGTLRNITLILGHLAESIHRIEDSQHRLLVEIDAVAAEVSHLER